MRPRSRYDAGLLVALLLAGVALALAIILAATAPAKAAASFNRAGTPQPCPTVRHGRYVLRICPLVHYRMRGGQLEVRAAGAAAVYGWYGKVPRPLALRTRLVGTSGYGRAYPYTTRLRVVRGPWATLIGHQNAQTRLLVYVQWPGERHWSAYLVYSRIVYAG